MKIFALKSPFFSFSVFITQIAVPYDGGVSNIFSVIKSVLKQSHPVKTVLYVQCTVYMYLHEIFLIFLQTDVYVPNINRDK